MGDLGRKRKEAFALDSSSKDEIIYPEVRVDAKDIKGLGDKKVGDKVKIHIEGEVKGINSHKDKNEYTIECHQGEMMIGNSMKEYKEEK